jgi:ketosteroid isomerase-like protein
MMPAAGLLFFPHRLFNSRWRESMADDVELLRRVYARFNGRDIDGVLAAMCPDVVWANGMEGGYVHGRDEVRSYWKRQWAAIDPHVEPIEIPADGAGEVVVKVHQVVRDLKGNLLADRMVIHVFQVRNGLIQRFDIRDLS